MTASPRDLPLGTLSRLLGVQTPASLDPREVPLVVTFQPVPAGCEDPALLEFVGRLEQLLRDRGVTVVPWKQAVVQHGGGARHLRDAIQAVFVLHTDHGPPAESISRMIRDHLNVQVVSITRMSAELSDPATPFQRKLQLGMAELARNFAPIVIGVSEDRIAVLNLNLSDTLIDADELPHYVESALLSKLAAPIRPVPLESFARSWFRAEDDPWVGRLQELAAGLGPTGLFPRGSQIRDLVGGLARSPVTTRLLEELTEGRSGVSYGFTALAAPAPRDDAVGAPGEAWERFHPVRDADNGELRQDGRGRWFVRVRSGDTELVLPVPDAWVYCSRSGAEDKTRLRPRDVVRVGLVKGRMHLQIPEGLDFADVHPSYDTRVMLSIALAAALCRPDLSSQEMPIVHFHGYPHPRWFEAGEYFSGERNPEFPCGTVHSALLAFREAASLCGEQDLRLGCIIEPGHGSVLLAKGNGLLLQRLHEGCGVGGGERCIELGGKFFRGLLAARGVSPPRTGEAQPAGARA